MKIFISADIEGVAGVVSPAQTVPAGFEYERAREWMTAEVNAACEGAIAGGADHIIVADSHGNGQSLLIDKLPKDVEVIRNWPRPLGMMQGVDEDGVQGAMLLGYHTGAHHIDGVLAHTSAGLLFTELRINGSPASETTTNAFIAGHFGVPIIFASGDDSYVRHAKESLHSETVTVETKVYKGRYSAKSLTPDKACAEIRRKAEEAMGKIGHCQPIVAASPVVFEADFQRHIPAEILSYLPCVERTGPLTIRFEAADMVAVSKFLSFVTSIMFNEQLP
ncbi:MAG: M55 family metallopeptidase [Pseudomonadota bacterium]